MEQKSKIFKILKKIYESLYNNKSKILFNASFASLFTAILFFAFALVASQYNAEAIDVFTYMSSICFAVWLIMVQGSDSVMKFLGELVKLILFFFISIWSMYYCLNICLNYRTVSIGKMLLSTIGLFACFFYFSWKFIGILKLIKNVFGKIKLKLFDSDSTTQTKTKAFIENVTAFLVSIGSLTVAIKVITESIFQIFEYVK